MTAQQPARAHDKSRYHRLVYVESGLVNGTFDVLLPVGDRNLECWVGAHDVTIYDSPERLSGRVFYSGDLKGSVEGGAASLSPHMIASDRREDALAHIEDVKAAMVAAAKVALAAGEAQ